MKPLTAEEIAELRRLDREGTPAPWRWDGDESEVRGPPGHEPHEDDYHLNVTEKGACVVETDGGFYGPHGVDRELLPAARNALPRLLDEVERSRRIPIADEADVKKLLAIIERSRALLKRIEWGGVTDIETGGTSVCPECGGEEPTRGREPDHDIGHRPGCEIAALLGRTASVD